MILKTYYDTGHTDTFDSDHLTDASMLRGNLLTNWSLDIGDARDGAGCLILSLYWYPVAGAGEMPDGPKGLPIARRREGWSFVVADLDDLPHLTMAKPTARWCCCALAEDSWTTTASRTSRVSPSRLQNRWSPRTTGCCSRAPKRPKGSSVSRSAWPRRYTRPSPTPTASSQGRRDPTGSKRPFHAARFSAPDAVQYNCRAAIPNPGI